MALMSKIIILTLLAAVILALFAGLYFLIKEPASSRKTLRSLILRIAITIALMLLLLLAVYMGWIVPHPVGG